MKFFIDTADVSEIKELAKSGLLDGVTTNPSLIKKSGRNINEVIKEICDIVPGPVSAEVTATEYDEMLREAEVLKSIAKNVTGGGKFKPDGDGGLIQKESDLTAFKKLFWNKKSWNKHNISRSR